MVAEGSRFGMWIDARRMRGPDLAVARDLKRLGASVMLIGQDVTEDAGDLVFRLPDMPAEWQLRSVWQGSPRWTVIRFVYALTSSKTSEVCCTKKWEQPRKTTTSGFLKKLRTRN